MNCTKCNATLADEAIYCAECGDQFAVNAQRAKVGEAFAKTKTILVNQTKHPIFLVVAILFSVMFASQVITMFSGGISGIFSGILPFIFMLLATIGLWKTYAAKEAAPLEASLRSASIYDAYTSVMYTIYIVLLSIFGAITAIIMLLGGKLVSDQVSDIGAQAQAQTGSDMGAGEVADSAMSFGIVAAIVVIVVFAIAITIVALFKSIYKKRRMYFKALAETAATGKYAPAKAPVIGSYIVGGATALGAIFPFALAFAGDAIADALFADVLLGLGDVGKTIMDLIKTMLSDATASFAVSGILSLVIGGYLVLSAVWMDMTHKAEASNRDLIKSECATLDAIEMATKDAIFAAEKQKRDAEAAIKKAEEDEAKKAQADFSAQQQQIMRMMMMQMMQQNGINPDDVASMVANAEAPVAEETAEEAVAEDTVAEEVAEEAVVEEAVAEEVVEEAVAEEAVAEEAVAEEAAEEVVAEEVAAEEIAEEEVVEEKVEETVE